MQRKKITHNPTSGGSGNNRHRPGVSAAGSGLLQPQQSTSRSCPSVYKIAFMVAAGGMLAIMAASSKLVLDFASIQQQLQNEAASAAARLRHGLPPPPTSSSTQGTRSRLKKNAGGPQGPTKTRQEKESAVQPKGGGMDVVPNNQPSRTSSSPSRRTQTDRGVDLTDPALYETVDLKGDSSTATVAGMASGYDLPTYERFVGSLRKSGFKGHIILGVAPNVSPKSLQYLTYRNVTVKVMRWVNCTYTDDAREGDIFKRTTCAHPYPDIKIRWSRFPLIRDWLVECTECTGPVLVMDVRDSFFQLDPFGPGSPALTGLQVYEEHKSQTTRHWLTLGPIEKCQGVQYNETMLCSGTTTGTRPAMIKYLDIMYEEMKYWIEHEECRFDINGDDQSMHNHLFYSGQLPFASAVENRHNGIVTTVGVEGSLVFKKHKENMKAIGKQASEPYPSAYGSRWIGKEYNVCDDEGFFTEFDGSRSRVIHQWDRFGVAYINHWLNKHELFKDPLPKSILVDSEEGTSSNPASDAKRVKAPIVKSSAPQNSFERREKTDTGISLTDPALYESIDLLGDSSTATVMGMASGYELAVYEKFVGSLRKSGYKGHIILGVAPDVSPKTLRYFRYRNVTAKVMRWVNCTYTDDTKKNDIFKKTQCAHPYSDIKIRWSRFPLQRDWLQECETCTGPVLVIDVRDSIFQLDPFGPGSPEITGLQVYEEAKSQTTQHWLTEWPIGACKGYSYNETMLCSGTTTGTRAAMLKYLEIMYMEMKAWISTPQCRFDINGDDQSIHNYLYYSGQLPFATAIPNREGGIVHTAGVDGSIVRKAHEKEIMERYNLTSPVMAAGRPYKGSTEELWIGPEFGLTDEEGYFSEFDGTRSRVVHQYDRFGANVARWLKKKGLTGDPTPNNFK